MGRGNGLTKGSDDEIPEWGKETFWPRLSADGRRRVGEFVANIAIGVSASIMTLVVAPFLADKSATAFLIAVGGMVVAILIAILALAVRMLTEERESDKIRERGKP